MERGGFPALFAVPVWGTDCHCQPSEVASLNGEVSGFNRGNKFGVPL